MDVPTSDTAAVVADGDDEPSALHSRLLAAVIDGDAALVDALLAQGASPNASAHDGQWPALHFAIEFDHPSILRRLIDAGASIDRPRPRYRTPLQHATEIECALLARDPDGPFGLRLVQPLLDAGANPLAVSKERPETPLEIASAANHEAAIRAMQGHR